MVKGSDDEADPRSSSSRKAAGEGRPENSSAVGPRANRLAQRHQGSFPWLFDQGPVLTRRDALMLSSAFFGAIAAAGNAQSAELPVFLEELKGWISTSRGKFLFSDGSLVPGHGKTVREALNVDGQAPLFTQAVAGLRPTWDNMSFDVPCIRSDGTQYLTRNAALAAPGLVIATVAFDGDIDGYRAITGARSTATPGGDPKEDAWTLTRTSDWLMQGLAATSAAVSFATTPEILEERIIVMLEIVGDQLQVWQAGATAEETLVGTRIASNGEQALLAKYYNDAITAIMQGCVFDFAQFSPAPSREVRRLLVQYFQNLLWPSITPPVAETVDGGQIEQGANKSVDVATPSSGSSLVVASIDVQPQVGLATPSGDSVVISVPAGAALGSYELRYCLRSDVSQARLVDFGRVDFQVVAGTGGQDLPFFGQYYGAGAFGRKVGPTFLLAGGDDAVSVFFWAERTGTITHFRYQRRTGDGYSRGDGGTYTVEIRPADPITLTPLANTSPICQISGYQPGNPGNAQAFLTIKFTSTGEVTAKQPYVLVWRNTGSNPENNYISMNNNFVWDSTTPDMSGPTGTDPRSVGTSPVAVSGWSPVWIDGDKEWYPLPNVTRNGEFRIYHGPALMGVRYSDGQWAGFTFGSGGGGGIYEADIGNPADNQVRVRFKVSRASRTVDGVFLRVPRYNSTSGNLLVTLESGPASDTSGNGQEIEQVSVSSSVLYDVGGNEDDTGKTDKPHFIWVPFTSNHTLTLGNVYSLRLSATGSLHCRVWNQEDNYWGVPDGSSTDDDTWEANRVVDWTAWEDARGTQRSDDAGATWSYISGRWMPILFRCV
jgi:hypothetical protein